MNRRKTEDPAELELVRIVFPPGVGLVFRIEGIIRIIVVNKPELFRDVEVDDDVKQEVIEWLQNPHQRDKTHWTRVQGPLFQIFNYTIVLVIESGIASEDQVKTSLQRSIKKLESIEKSREGKKRGGASYDWNDRLEH